MTMTNETKIIKERFALNTHSFSGGDRCWWCDCRPFSKVSLKPCEYRPNIEVVLADAGYTWEDYA